MQELLLKTKSFILSSLLHKLLRVPKDAHGNFGGGGGGGSQAKQTTIIINSDPIDIIISIIGSELSKEYT